MKNSGNCTFFVKRCFSCVVSLFVFTAFFVFSSLPYVQAEDSVSGIYRYQKNKLDLSFGCAILLPGSVSSEAGAKYVVTLSDKSFDCKKAISASDPKQAVGDILMELDQGSVEFVVNSSSEIENNTIFFQTWSPLDSLSLQGVYETKVSVSADGSRIKGKFSSGGVKTIQMATEREIEVDLSFDLGILK
ncbi:MAG TPA: hypothetical protein PKA63_07810 [Oligoflexia bacterium]|nr:hypothetical protein [Oligoflexia bacterium]HMP48555.1 hypothetical protein [Oligoflexia bacterium]